ncbi:AMP-binding protein [Rhodococcus sp. 3Y1]
MFTSGSTGRPKGWWCRMRGGESVVVDAGEFPLGVGDVVLQKTPVSFDVSVWSCFGR